MRIAAVLGVFAVSCAPAGRTGARPAPPPDPRPAPEAAVDRAPVPAEPLPDFLAWWDFGDPAGTERRFRDLLPRAEASADRPYLVRLLTQIARTEGLQGRFDAAHATLDRAEGLLRPDLHEGRSRVRMERGRAWNSAKQPAKARPLFREALDAAREARDDGLAVDAVHMLAIIAEGDEALRWNLEALRMVEASTDPRARRWRGSLLNNLGWTYFAQGDFERAARYHQENWDWQVAEKKEPGARIAKWSHAKALRALGQLERALALQQELLAEYEGVKEEDGFVYEELGEVLLAQGKPEEAKPWFRKAHAALSKDAAFARDEAARLARLLELGDGTGSAAR